MKRLLICLLVLTLASATAWADPGPDQKHIDSIKKKVAQAVDHHRLVVIATFDNRRLQGFVSEAAPDHFILSYDSQPHPLSYADVKKIRWQSALSKQGKALIGAVIVTGVLFGMVAALGGLRD